MVLKPNAKREKFTIVEVEDGMVKGFGDYAQPQTEEEIHQMRIGYRKGDVLSPKLDTREALAVELDHLADCLANNRTPINDGKLGARVVQMMEAAETSMCSNGAPIHLKALV